MKSIELVLALARNPGQLETNTTNIYYKMVIAVMLKINTGTGRLKLLKRI